MHNDTLVPSITNTFDDALYAVDIDHRWERYLVINKNPIEVVAFELTEKKLFYIPGVVLCPKIPFINEGSRILPPMSDPTANGTPAADTMQPAPPELPPAIRFKSYGLLVVP